MEIIMLIGNNHPKTNLYSPIDENIWHKEEYNLGAHYNPKNNYITFAVYSKNAQHILLEIYDKLFGEDAKYDYFLIKNPNDNIWRAKIKANKTIISNGLYYAFRCWGANWTYNNNWKRGNSSTGFIIDVNPNGDRFNPNKVLFDPYARELSHEKETLEMINAGENAAMFGSGGILYNGIPRRFYDTGKWAIKGLVIHEISSFGEKPKLSPEKAIIYEAHLKGLTQHPSASSLQTILQDMTDFNKVKNVPNELRGTYAGASYMSKYLKELGVTTIELLPVQSTASSLDIISDINYWGYMTYGYFAPDRRYAYDKSPGGPTKEFKNMVKAFHDEGLEVYIDVVYNHTAEGGIWNNDPDTAEIVSFRGFDNQEYYELTSGPNNNTRGLIYYWESTGCGNNFFCTNDPVRKLILDSLEYWANIMGVDGFRFDIATVLGRVKNYSYGSAIPDFQFQNYSQTLNDIANWAEKNNVEIIAEPWDTSTYQLGNFPQGWAEWNGHYRDVLRNFTQGLAASDEFVKVINGDFDKFYDQGGPHKSINFITCHDGFTLLDLVSYNSKTNWYNKETQKGNPVWPFGPSEGGSDCGAWDSNGYNELDLHAFRRQRLRNFWIIQFFSRGVPMITAGDEFGRTQNGNVNPYNIDSIAMWLNYSMINSNSPTSIPIKDNNKIYFYHDNYGKNVGDNNKLFHFAHFVINLRKKHHALKQRKYGDLILDKGNDVTYLFKKPDGYNNLEQYDKCIWLRIDGSEVNDMDFLLFINMHYNDINFTVPQTNKQWIKIIDTHFRAENNANYWDMQNSISITNNINVPAYSITVLCEKS